MKGCLETLVQSTLDTTLGRDDVFLIKSHSLNKVAQRYQARITCFLIFFFKKSQIRYFVYFYAPCLVQNTVALSKFPTRAGFHLNESRL